MSNKRIEEARTKVRSDDSTLEPCHRLVRLRLDSLEKSSLVLPDGVTPPIEVGQFVITGFGPKVEEGWGFRVGDAVAVMGEPVQNKQWPGVYFVMPEAIVAVIRPIQENAELC